MSRFLIVILTLLFAFETLGQSRTIEFGIYNLEDKSPIPDVHIFLANASIGSISDANGNCSLTIPKARNEELIISHLAFNTSVLTPDVYLNLQQGDSILLEPNGVNLEEITIVYERNGKWKRQFRLFKSVLLGIGDAADKCEILNPHALRFQNKNGVFKATAVDLLKISNDHLGYDLDFLLSSLIVEADGSRSYHGFANFKDRPESAANKKVLKNRQGTFLASPRHFYLSLLNDELEDNEYALRIAQYTNGQFKTISEPTADQILKRDSISGNYQLSFTDFLEVTNGNVRHVLETDLSGKLSNLERSKFNNSQSQKTIRSRSVVSQLYKIAPYLLIDANGNLINQKDVREYGFWAEQRLANTLPLDYVSPEAPNTTIDIVQEVKQEPKDEPAGTSNAQEQQELITEEELDFEASANFFRLNKLLSKDSQEHKAVLDYFNDNWSEDLIPALLEVMGVSRNSEVVVDIGNLLFVKTGQLRLRKYYSGLSWLWEQKPLYDADFANFKARAFMAKDIRFQKYFQGRQSTARIRLDEIVWGGVQQDGIPPLRLPKVIAANEANYLNDQDVVFGFYMNGVARAYPKRILAWHEMVVDTLGGTNIAGVYCTLCGTMIAYDQEHKGKVHELGTSGFLYRSNKLMYDKATQSLWSTILGAPVLGPLVDQDIQLKTYALVTTTWGEWKDIHPKSTVLSLDTGHSRNYAEGEAYKAYFADDKLMFPVPLQDTRLPNKAEVLVVRVAGYEQDPLAVSIAFLQRKKIYQDRIGEQGIVFIAEPGGAARAYESGNNKFRSFADRTLADKSGASWTVTEEALLGPNGEKLARLPAHNIFWFAWVNSFPDTRLRY